MEGRTALIERADPLDGSTCQACDLRAGAAFIAGLIARAKLSSVILTIFIVVMKNLTKNGDVGAQIKEMSKMAELIVLARHGQTASNAEVGFRVFRYSPQ